MCMLFGDDDPGELSFGQAIGCKGLIGCLRVRSRFTMQLVRRAEQHGRQLALIGNDGTMSYAELLEASASAARTLLGGADDLQQRRVAFLMPRDLTYVVAQWGVWRAGGVAVPLCDAHPPPELEYVIRDAEADTIVAHRQLVERVAPIARVVGCRLLTPEDLVGHAVEGHLPSVEPSRDAMIVYTSGTTGRPKGAVSTHANLEAQITTLVDAWGWSSADHILHVLPLHHVHGIVNVLACALWAGGVCEMLSKFDADAVWEAFAGGRVNVFMAVPTIYARLIAAYDGYDVERRAILSKAAAAMRLMVSGSAALPVQTLQRWQAITGHVLLERYGMTELGMALSNPLDGERRPGFVGCPLPGVQIRLVDEAGDDARAGEPGELWVRGPSVFKGYYRKPEVTREAFTDDWFRTGDIAVLESGSYRILGRSSVDIIKSGGYKISALEVESVLRDHPAIEEVAVVGLADATWGQRVCAAVVLRSDQPLSLEALQTWARERLARYKVPSRLVEVEALPRNVLGKVTKPDVAKLFD